MTTPEAPPPPQTHKDASVRSLEKTEAGIVAVLGTFQAKLLPELAAEIKRLAELCEKEKLALQSRCTAQADELSTQVASLEYQLHATQRSKTQAEQELSDARARAEELKAQVEALKARVGEETAMLRKHTRKKMEGEEEERQEMLAAYWEKNREAEEAVDDYTNVVQTQANEMIAAW